MDDRQINEPPQKDGENLLLCKVCGEWIDRRDLDEIYDHLDHHTGSNWG